MCGRMRVEVDAGNTRIKWRVLIGGSVVGSGAITHQALFSQGLPIAGMGEAEQIVVSSVANNEVCDKVREIAKAHKVLNSLVFIETKPVMSGVSFAYQDVSRLGVDRCVAMVAAYEKYQEGVLVVDCGSAITADFVRDDGVHIGGFILPGLQMLKGALLGGTANVLVEAEAEVSIEPGRSTEECVEHGRYLIVYSLLQELRVKAKEYGIERLVLTGGDGSMIAGLSDQEWDWCPDLVFEGLGVVVPMPVNEKGD